MNLAYFLGGLGCGRSRVEPHGCPGKAEFGFFDLGFVTPHPNPSPRGGRGAKCGGEFGIMFGFVLGRGGPGPALREGLVLGEHSLEPGSCAEGAEPALSCVAR